MEEATRRRFVDSLLQQGPRTPDLFKPFNVTFQEDPLDSRDVVVCGAGLWVHSVDCQGMHNLHAIHL